MTNDPAIPLATRAPPLPTLISRRVWIGIALGAGLVGLLLCVGGGLGIVYLAGVGSLARPSVVGKWEFAALKGGETVEFKANGTGAFFVPVLGGAKLTPQEIANFNEAGIKDGVRRSEFKWHVTREEKPVLVIENAGGKEQGDGIFDVKEMPASRDHFHFKREGDTLTLTPLQPGLPVVLRRLK